MDFERKLSSLEEELASLKKEGTKISDDTRKALIFDIVEKSKNSRYKALTIGVGIMAVILSLVATIGFQSVQNKTAEYIVGSELKKQVLSELSREKLESEKNLIEARLIVEQLRTEENKLENRIEKLLSKVDAKQKSLERVSNVIAKLGVANRDIATIIEPEMLNAINDSNIFIFFNSFGISNVSVIKLLATETEGFNFHNITKNSIRDNVKQIQERYELSVDGNLGPCTSLVIGSLLLDNYEVETRKELEMSSFNSEKWLTNSYQTCSQRDKSQIQRYVDYPDLPMHIQLNNFITATGIPRKDFLKNLTKNMPEPIAYKALSYIGYE
ncbi:hypothetical protein [Photobacterium indicum]|uniref:Uncharacterized protein n=1 Tax=Photobacterium indicum TaxID=81447 RepID=A0A2T3LF87_9GAMM|nr:hypothetical protein [Photobacterium indicum]PSV50050.1 hypothetical protein C9J47_05735 [Photobacterium indicum]